MSKERLIKSIREIPDFPIPGILFYDVTTLFKDAACLQELSDTMYEMYKDKGITKVVGIESRGFIMGPILATRLDAGFIPIRKPGKLPAETIEESYDKEYGKDTIQIHKDALDENDIVLLHDDLLATGGTMKAACELVKKLKPKKVYVNFIIELKELNGKAVFGDDVEIESVSPRVPSEPIRVTGVVVDANYQPIIGAQIMEDCKPLHGTATNINGEFQIAISGKNLLKCKAIGYLEQEIRIDPNTQFHPRLTVKLEDSPALMGGVIVIDTRWTHDDIYH